MSKQSPPTYNIYFVAGSLSRSSGTLSSSPRPATPEVIASVQASSSHFQPDVSAPRRPPLPPGRFSNSAPAAAAARPRLPAAPISVAPGPPRPSRAPIILKEARSNARDRSLSSRGRSRSPAHSAHRASSIASIRSERPVERPPGTWDAEGIWQTPLYSVHAVDAFPSFPHSPTQPVTPFNVFQSNLGGLTQMATSHLRHLCRPLPGALALERHEYLYVLLAGSWLCCAPCLQLQHSQFDTFCTPVALATLFAMCCRCT